jgi:uncharacterized membrane-anchored protein YhcB (DUF1043 family)
MTWLIIASSLLVGVVIGLLLGGRLSASPARLRELENELREAREAERRYRSSVGDHFSMTADLVHHMTQSYREVYDHLASGAQDLCSDEVAAKLLPAKSDANFSQQAAQVGSDQDESTALAPPRDYAAKASPDQKGALAEDFGIEKPAPKED